MVNKKKHLLLIYHVSASGYTAYNFTPCSSVSIANFKQVNAGWVMSNDLQNEMFLKSRKLVSAEWEIATILCKFPWGLTKKRFAWTKMFFYSLAMRKIYWEKLVNSKNIGKY